LQSTSDGNIVLVDALPDESESSDEVPSTQGESAMQPLSSEVNDAIEKAAKALFDAMPSSGPPIWELQPENIKDVFRAKARAARR
jgi:hypothetical protein